MNPLRLHTANTLTEFLPTTAGLTVWLCRCWRRAQRDENGDYLRWGGGGRGDASGEGVLRLGTRESFERAAEGREGSSSSLRDAMQDQRDSKLNV